MKISEYAPKFDPAARILDKKSLLIVFSATEWAGMELAMKKHLSREDIREIILGVFSNKYKLVKR